MQDGSGESPAAAFISIKRPGSGEIDSGFLLRSGNAVNAFRAARAAGPDESRYCSHRRDQFRPDEVPSFPLLFCAAFHYRIRLVTSGERRISEAIREEASKVGLLRSAVIK